MLNTLGRLSPGVGAKSSDLGLLEQTEDTGCDGRGGVERNRKEVGCGGFSERKLVSRRIKRTKSLTRENPQSRLIEEITQKNSEKPCDDGR